MKVTTDEPFDDFAATEKIPRRKLHRMNEAKEDARKDLKGMPRSSEDLKELKKGLESLYSKALSPPQKPQYEENRKEGDR